MEYPIYKVNSKYYEGNYKWIDETIMLNPAQVSYFDTRPSDKKMNLPKGYVMIEFTDSKLLYAITRKDFNKIFEVNDLTSLEKEK